MWHTTSCRFWRSDTAPYLAGSITPLAFEVRRLPKCGTLAEFVAPLSRLAALLKPLVAECASDH